MTTYYSILAWRIPWTEKPGGYSPWGRKELDMTVAIQHAHTQAKTNCDKKGGENRLIVVGKL